MCYDDGGPYFVGPDGEEDDPGDLNPDDKDLVTVCGKVYYWWFDCKKDDYYNPHPPPGSHLHTHAEFNVANNDLLTAPPP